MSAQSRPQGKLLRGLFGLVAAGAALALPAPVSQAALPGSPPPTPAAPPAGEDPMAVGQLASNQSSASLPALLDQLKRLYRKAEEATEDYNATKDKLDRQHKLVAKLGSKLDDRHADIAQQRKDAGALARRQYRYGGLSAYGKLLLSGDPQHALEQGQLLAQAARSQAGVITDLRAEEKNLRRLTAKHKAALKQIEKSTREQRAARDRVNAELNRVRSIVSSLTGAQLDQLQALEERGSHSAQAAFVKSGVLGTDRGVPSKAGERAVAYALAQLGDPYVWGAQGPDSFDCSGLTSQAWLHAGKPIPRTSQEQWRQLPKVSLDRLRPGDLVIYYPGATHVAMYLGKGLIIQAPRPGSVVKVSPVGSMPALGAVRPDPDAPSADHYQLPKLPASAQAPTPIGPGRPGSRPSHQGSHRPTHRPDHPKQAQGPSPSPSQKKPKPSVTPSRPPAKPSQSAKPTPKPGGPTEQPGAPSPTPTGSATRPTPSPEPSGSADQGGEAGLAPEQPGGTQSAEAPEPPAEAAPSPAATGADG